MVSDSYAKRSGSPRAIPKSTMVDIQANTNHRGELSPADLAAVASLSEELQHLGISRPVETMRGISSEEELNPEYHSSRLDEALMGLEGTSNPLMEKFDDYEGIDYNPAFRARDKFESFRRGSKAKKGRTL